jgi:hypothetical protein
MPKVKLAWRFRKGSEANPILKKDCGCEYYVYDGTVIRHCELHKAELEEESDDTDKPTQ